MQNSPHGYFGESPINLALRRVGGRLKRNLPTLSRQTRFSEPAAAFVFVKECLDFDAERFGDVPIIDG
jgi:hypothetical protein